jgi:hypothetical protein
MEAKLSAWKCEENQDVGRVSKYLPQGNLLVTYKGKTVTSQ